MAIFHHSTKPVRRADGRSSVAAAAYRAGDKLIDHAQNRVWDFGKKRGVVYSEIRVPEGEATPSRQELWDAAEAAEKRKDGRTAREFELALPKELDDWSRMKACREYADFLIKTEGCAVDFSIHAPQKGNDNYHCHMMVTTRRFEKGELTEKCKQEWSRQQRQKAGLSDDKANLTYQRQVWAEIQNGELERAGSTERVDHRSHAERGETDAPLARLSRREWHADKAGKSSEKATYNRQIRAERAKKSSPLKESTPAPVPMKETTTDTPPPQRTQPETPKEAPKPTPTPQRKGFRFKVGGRMEDRPPKNYGDPLKASAPTTGPLKGNDNNQQNSYGEAARREAQRREEFQRQENQRQENQRREEFQRQENQRQEDTRRREELRQELQRQEDAQKESDRIWRIGHRNNETDRYLRPPCDCFITSSRREAKAALVALSVNVLCSETWDVEEMMLFLMKVIAETGRRGQIILPEVDRPRLEELERQLRERGEDEYRTRIAPNPYIPPAPKKTKKQQEEEDDEDRIRPRPM